MGFNLVFKGLNLLVKFRDFQTESSETVVIWGYTNY